MIRTSIVIDESQIQSILKRATDEKTKEMSEKIIRDTRRIIKSSANRNFPNAVAKFAPDRHSELGALTDGYPADERTMRKTADGFMYMKDAIRRYAKFDVRDNVGARQYTAEIYLTPESYDDINAKIGFGWLKFTGKDSAESRSTRDVAASPEWDNLLGAWEDGFVFHIKPRDGKYLYPNSGNLKEKYPYMNKTIPPFKMFNRGMGDASINKLISLITNDIKQKYGDT